MTNIYVSTGGFGSQNVENIVAKFVDSGINRIELSGGITSPETLLLLRQYKKNGCDFILHNYFPAPVIKPFVLNLGSTSKMVRNRSRDLILEALRWSSELEANFYGIHAPFRLDPRIQDLGKGFELKKLSSYNETLKIFCDEYSELRGLGKNYGVDLAIENNVISAIDHDLFGRDHPFIFTGVEPNPFVDYLGDEVSFLLDYGHLKVSAMSLQFDKMEALDTLSPKIKWCHLSENNGLIDSNQRFDDKAWFFEHLKSAAVPSTIEVYRHSVDSLKKLQEMTLRML